MTPYEREMLAIALYAQWRAESLSDDYPEPPWSLADIRVREHWRSAADEGELEFVG